jgi:hypothetical protein
MMKKVVSVHTSAPGKIETPIQIKKGYVQSELFVLTLLEIFDSIESIDDSAIMFLIDSVLDNTEENILDISGTTRIANGT